MKCRICGCYDNETDACEECNEYLARFGEQPSRTIDEVEFILMALSKEDREAVIFRFCVGCGDHLGHDPRGVCYCRADD